MFWKKKSKSSDKTEDKVFYHEDMYLQIEVLPFSNIEFCKKQTSDISEFSEEHKDGIGYTDVFVRDSEKYPLVEERINVNSIKECFDKNLDFCGNVYTGYGSYQVKAEDVICYFKDNLKVFFDTKGDFIENIWISGYISEERDADFFVSAFLKLGTRYDLILCDWESGLVADLKKQEEVKIFFDNFIFEG